MIIEEVSKEIYDNFVENKGLIFNSSAFNEINKFKMDEVKYLLFKDNKYRFGLCVGIKEREMLCPFSAPFGTLVEVKSPVSIRYYDDAVDALDSYAVQNKYKNVKFTLPPTFYDEAGINSWINVLFRKGYSLKNVDLNFQLNLRKVWSPSYADMIPRNGRKNLRIGINSGLILKRCEDIEQIKLAYDVIAENRQGKGYPLRMTFDQVLRTTKVVNNDIFLVLKGEDAIASSLIYYINDKVVQVIYWGDRPGFSEYKPINFLAYQLIDFYGNKGLQYLDIGPSTEDSMPNYGLCDFKESIGCDISTKITMTKRYW